MAADRDIPRRLARRVGAAGVVAVAVAAFATAGSSPAWAGGAQTFTEHVHGSAPLDPDFGGNPCNGDPLTGTQDENLVDHETVNGDELRGTFSEEAWVYITDIGTGVVYTGHYVVSGTHVFNQQDQANTFVFSTNLKGSDGSSITGHEVTHFVLRPDGSVQVDFDKPRLSCSG